MYIFDMILCSIVISANVCMHNQQCLHLSNLDFCIIKVSPENGSLSPLDQNTEIPKQFLQLFISNHIFMLFKHGQ